MKKYILLFITLISQYGIANTPPPNFKQYLGMFDDCDACGCSASGGGMGFSSMLNQNFVGVRYFYQSYTSRDGIFNDSPKVDENFNTAQLWARIPVFKNFQVSALVPYHSHNRELSTGYQEINGLGDITVLGLYTVYQTQKDSVVYNHVLQAGGGVKMPTGDYKTTNNGSVNPSFQVGTGSWDYLLAAEYVVRRDRLGLNTMLNYSIKTENDDNYQFGNQLNYGSTLFYIIEKPKYSLVPQLGLAGENYAANKQFGEKLPDTEGDIFFGKAGIEAGYQGFSIGINTMLPISQNLVGGRVESNYRWSINLNYSL
ncbi:MAG: hypothetical protein BM557_04745 [Flavobacterium sp. MedPE-SWcel]|uniref:transporter n=1 Tax=uncultured Flavobacterium sp. TaxID=165435 RepID=UPI000914C114|nr:transporter [uncultured Flavobacterium sp.]OIQ21068.1 MAG: hypothetical protein BM557_04745 [Flavobacterium sp. MedPE-SWcel]